MIHFSQKNCRTFLLATLLAAVVHSGCTVTSTLNRNSLRTNDRSIGIDEFNSVIDHKSIVIVLHSGKKLRAEDGVLSGKVFDFQNPRSGERNSISLDSVREVSYDDHIGGFADAAMLMILPAVIVSVNYGMDASNARPPTWVRGAVVYVTGLGLGTAWGKKHVYEVLPDSSRYVMDP